jgi:hypothetical protein
MSLTKPSPSSIFRTINGVYGAFDSTFGRAATWHNGTWIRRVATVGDATASYYRCAKNTGGTIFLIPHVGSTTGEVGRVEPAASNAATALFEG